MSLLHPVLLALAAWLAGSSLAAQTVLTDPTLQLKTWTVAGVPREAAVYVPPSAATAPRPLVFVFHGANNSMNSIIKFFAFHGEWPEAVIVYMQGLISPLAAGRVEKRADGSTKSGTGWQLLPGATADRDLAFFDAALATLRREHAIDPARIYATGHSAGAGFTSLLWQTRGDTLAAVALVAGGLLAAAPERAAAMSPGTPFTATDPARLLRPKPALIVAGRQDQTVPFVWMERMVALAKQVNGCTAASVPWGTDLCAWYPAQTRSTPVVTYFHPGGHGVPKDAVGLIVKFFHEHASR